MLVVYLLFTNQLLLCSKGVSTDSMCDSTKYASSKGLYWERAVARRLKQVGEDQPLRSLYLTHLAFFATFS